MSLPNPILIVCDDAPARELARQALGAEGAEVVETADAEYAVEILEQRADIRAIFAATHQLGLLSGLELARMAGERWPAIKHVVVTAHMPPADLPRSASFLQRPFDPDGLIRLLRQPATGRDA